MAWVQRSTSGLNNAGTPNRATLTLTGTVAGNDVIVSVVMPSSSYRTFTVADSVNGGYGAAAHYVDMAGRVVAFYRKKAGLGGDLTITVDASGSGTFAAIADEVSGLDQSAAAITGSEADTGDTTSHPCASSGNIDTTRAAFVVAGSAAGGPLTTGTPASGWTGGAIGANNQTFFQYYDAPSALTDERGTWTSSPARLGRSAMVAFLYVDPEAPTAHVSGGWFGR